MCKLLMCHSIRGLLPALLLIFSSNLHALHHLSPRLQIGINLLPAIMAANPDLNSLRDEQKSLTVWIVYSHDVSLAEAAAIRLSEVKTIRGLELHTRPVAMEELLKSRPRKGSAVLLIEKLESLTELIAFCTRQQILLFSPFKGDVKNGVMSGFEVTNKVLPAINLAATRRANIRLKAFFLRIAVKYGDHVEE